jgi:hypothetical protein
VGETSRSELAIHEELWVTNIELMLGGLSAESHSGYSQHSTINAKANLVRTVASRKETVTNNAEALC